VIRVALLGATGSIGTSSLAIAREFHDRIRLVSLAAGSNAEALVTAAEEFGVRRIALGNLEAAAKARGRFHGEVGEGSAGVDALASDPDVDVVVNALVGSVGLTATVAALRAGKRVALANKESIVVAGELLSGLARQHGGEILPVDSEHGGLHQCLLERDPASIRRVILTASGGPFLRRALETLPQATPEEVLKHPTWSMGARITVDSATLPALVAATSPESKDGGFYGPQWPGNVATGVFLLPQSPTFLPSPPYSGAWTSLFSTSEK